MLIAYLTRDGRPTLLDKPSPRSRDLSAARSSLIADGARSLLTPLGLPAERVFGQRASMAHTASFGNVRGQIMSS